jgi:hypothetical protein
VTWSPNPGDVGRSEPSYEPTQPLRASDADREAVVRALHDAVGRGQLTVEEGDERVGAAYATRFVRDLRSLTADLYPAPTAPVAPGWRALAAVALLQLRTSLATISWRSTVASKRRLAVAVLLVLTVIALGVMTFEDLFEHGDDFD